ncbi:hypothetical protein GCM10010515_31060 [Streptomyces fructofermentans]|uniref:Uncharacterized protein n=1 Tax=Streptomyces fructofermentans TaxID=152141 RepID=A0A918KGT9_9ACTN|nr:hypothetical protein GCM10010515_31060 [Streptomyces fructofermentans]
MNGNSFCAAGTPPTTGAGAAWAARGWRLAVARATAPTAAARRKAVLPRKLNLLLVNIIPFMGI